MPLSVGDKAPLFDVTASDGRNIKLSDYAGKKNVVVFFYPGDFTPVCTKESCGFQDMYKDLLGKNTEVIGVSSDDDESHKKFAAKYKLEFPLIADTKFALATDFKVHEGVLGAIGKLFGRVLRYTFVIDKDGKIAGVFHAEVSAGVHTDGVRELVSKLNAA
jgi:thioredoxin-dependent peroxiredoxin